MQLDERVLGPVGAHRTFDGGLHLEDEQVLGATEGEEPPVQLQLGCRVFVDRQAGLGAACHLDVRGEQLDPPSFHAGVLHDRPANSDGRPHREIETDLLDGRRSGFRLGALECDLHAARPVPDRDEDHALEHPYRRDESGDEHFSAGVREELGNGSPLHGKVRDGKNQKKNGPWIPRAVRIGRWCQSVYFTRARLGPHPVVGMVSLSASFRNASARLIGMIVRCGDCASGSSADETRSVWPQALHLCVAAESDSAASRLEMQPSLLHYAARVLSRGISRGSARPCRASMLAGPAPRAARKRKTSA
jgi:hypothetical protein